MLLYSQLAIRYFKGLSLCFFVLFFNASFTQAECTKAVPNEYIVVTKYPEDVLNISSHRFKTKTNLSPFIYDHRSSESQMKTSEKTLTSLSFSTLILKLSDAQVEKISKIDETSITKNCYVDFELGPSSINNSSKDDPLFSRQWGLNYFLQNTKTNEGIKKIKVAVSDTGFDINHEDLKDNLSINFTEYNGRPNVDDDNNGCVDDVHGCDVTIQNGDVGINTYKSNLIDHGTHVAGIIGALSNNQVGVSGAGSNIELLLIRAFSSLRKTTSADLIKSIYYAVNNKAEILNCSWGTGSRPTLAEFNAFEYARINNVVVVTAAGNSATHAASTSPAGLSNVLTVGSFNSSLQLSTFSNFGKAVDILAPGGDGIERKNDGILSTVAYSKYAEKKGTSMAAPFVSAALANVKSAYPFLKRTELLNIILSSADVRPVNGFFDTNYTDELRFLNFPKAMKLGEDYQTSIQSNSSSVYEFDFEPKDILSPSSLSQSSNSNLDETLTNSSQGSGCNHFNSHGRAANLSWFFLFLPFVFLQIKKRTLL